MNYAPRILEYTARKLNLCKTMSFLNKTMINFFANTQYDKTIFHKRYRFKY